MSRRRRGCGNVGIRRSLPDFQARRKEGETRFLSFPRFPRRGISAAWQPPFFHDLPRLCFWSSSALFFVRRTEEAAALALARGGRERERQCQRSAGRFPRASPAGGGKAERDRALPAAASVRPAVADRPAPSS